MNSVVLNEGQGRYELTEGGAVAIAAFEPHGDSLTFSHTLVPEALRGRGIGGRLIAGALDDVRARGRMVVPLCPFVARFIDDNPAYRDLVA